MNLSNIHNSAINPLFQQRSAWNPAASKLLKDLIDNDGLSTSETHSSSSIYNIDQEGTITHSEFLSYAENLDKQAITDNPPQPGEIIAKIYTIRNLITEAENKNNPIRNNAYHDVTQDLQNVANLLHQLETDQSLRVMA